jgi:hypothetical protein
MPSYADVTPPPWDEASSFRETMVLWIDDPEDRELVRRFGRLLYDCAVEASREMGDGASPTRVELRAVAADLRYLHGYLLGVGREAEESTLPPEDDALAHFAARLAGQVGSLAAAIERSLS